MSAEPNPPTVVALVGDLIFESKINATARAADVRVHCVRTNAALATQVAAVTPALVLLDLNVAGDGALEAIQQVRECCPSARIVGFASHVDAALLEQARTGGADEVMPRSRFDASLAQILSTCPAARES